MKIHANGISMNCEKRYQCYAFDETLPVDTWVVSVERFLRLLV